VRSQLLEFIGRAVSKRFEDLHSPTNGAALADEIRAHFRGDPFSASGFEKLGDAIREAESLGLLVRNFSVKHLEVYPPGVEMRRFERNPQTDGTPNYIRQDAWQAFAMQRPSKGKTVYDRRVGKFRTDPVSTDASDETVEVQTPSNEEYCDWIIELAQKLDFQVPPEVFGATTSPRHFSQWITANRPSDVWQWKKIRAEKVARALIDWCTRMNIDPTPFLSPVIPSYRKTLDRVPSSTGGHFKNALIACINDMSLDELDALAIPVRCVRKHFQPR